MLLIASEDLNALNIFSRRYSFSRAKYRQVLPSPQQTDRLSEGSIANMFTVMRACWRKLEKHEVDAEEAA